MIETFLSAALEEVYRKECVVTQSSRERSFIETFHLDLYCHIKKRSLCPFVYLDRRKDRLTYLYRKLQCLDKRITASRHLTG